MKKFLLGLFMACALVACDTAPQEAVTMEIEDNKVYLFTMRGCPHCVAIKEYIQKNHADAPVQVYDIRADKAAYAGYENCRKKFAIKDQGVPLLCAGKNYLHGWSEQHMAQELAEYLKPFAPAQK